MERKENTVVGVSNIEQLIIHLRITQSKRTLRDAATMITRVAEGGDSGAHARRIEAIHVHNAGPPHNVGPTSKLESVASIALLASQV